MVMTPRICTILCFGTSPDNVFSNTQNMPTPYFGKHAQNCVLLTRDVDEVLSHPDAVSAALLLEDTSCVCTQSLPSVFCSMSLFFISCVKLHARRRLTAAAFSLMHDVSSVSDVPPIASRGVCSRHQVSSRLDLHLMFS